RALMEHGVYSGQATAQQTFAKIVLIQIVGNGCVCEVNELIAFQQIVHCNDVGNATGVQAPDQLAADKAGSAGNDDHDCNSSGVTMEVPSLPTTMLAARLAQVTASIQLAPAARMTATVASTVSPAPETSNTSWACASTW